MIRAVIDGRAIEVEQDTTILEAAEKLSIPIPTLCHHKALEPYGVCRLCTVEVVRRRLKKVMNPMAGLDLVRTNLVRDIKVDDGTVSVVVDLPPDHQFATAIGEEIQEKIEPLWDVQEVAVEFAG